MGIGTSIFLIAAGAIMTFAVETDSSNGFNINNAGVILMILGAIGLAVTMLIWGPRRRQRDGRARSPGRTVVHRRTADRALRRPASLAAACWPMGVRVLPVGQQRADRGEQHQRLVEHRVVPRLGDLDHRGDAAHRLEHRRADAPGHQTVLRAQQREPAADL